MRQILLLGPQLQLQRGFALIQDQQGRVIRHAQDLQIDQTIQIQFSDGTRTASVKS
jgi:exonuclease VII large subunit